MINKSNIETTQLLESCTELTILGVELFGSDESFKLWLSKGNPYFYGACPALYMHTLNGHDQIKNYLQNIAHGNLS